MQLLRGGGAERGGWSKGWGVEGVGGGLRGGREVWGE